MLLDTRDKPYKCSCGSAFTRRDLLTRHWRISQHDGEATTIASTPSAVGSTQYPQQRDQNQPQHLAFDGLTGNGESRPENGSHLVQPPRMEYPTPDPNLHHAPVPLMNQGTLRHSGSTQLLVVADFDPRRPTPGVPR